MIIYPDILNCHFC